MPSFRHILTPLACLLLSLPSHTRAQTRYHLTDLGILPGTIGSSAEAINEAGQVVGYCSLPSSSNITARAFLWSNGQMIDLSYQGGSSVARDINNSGQVLISGDHNAIYDNAGMHPLPKPPTSQDFAPVSLNNAGHVAGAAYTDRNHAYLYNGTNFATVGPGSDISAAYAVNDAGHITGVGYNPDPHPFLYTPGSGPRYIPILSPDTQGRGYAINEAGDVVGDGWGFLPARNRAFRYTHTGLLTELLPPTNSVIPNAYARAINNLGQVVGISGNENAPSFGTRGILWTSNDVPVDLTSSLHTSIQGWTIGAANGINDQGQIAASAWYDPDGSGPVQPIGRAVLLTPLPSLSITNSGNQLTISWPTNSLNLALFAKASPTPGTWQPVTNTPLATSGKMEVQIHFPITGHRFFQLQSP